MAQGMGFKAAAMQAGGGNYKKGAAIVAVASRKASPAAKAKNPNLKKVLPAKKGNPFAKGGKPAFKTGGLKSA